ncbi:MAG: hypothetical protein NZ959_00635 [Armatimonadetes bacterium]|nr:hypothetical protein [Armatimonadota bacterium]MDW8121105.1 hypothetical protein [Armatimonadota bacterium]
MPFLIFDRSRLDLKPLTERVHDFHLSEVMDLEASVPEYDHPGLDHLAEKMVEAKERGAPVLILMGAHPIKNGLSRYFIDLMERGFPVHLAMNGAGPIHDFELALIGATTESVARYIREGQFGLWKETGLINDAIKAGYRDGLGMGEAIGRYIVENEFPFREISVLATAYRLGRPVTVHIGIGYDIIHEHPNCDGAALGATSYRDFLILAHTVSQLQGGVVLNIGSQVMGPEVFLKALAMARNVAHQEGRRIDQFSVGVFDMAPLPDTTKEPPKTEWAYYFRPLKTLLVRTVAGGGQSFYIRGDHRVTLPNLYKRVVRLEEGRKEK